MKKIYLGTLIFLTTLIPNTSLGATKNFTINWSTSEPIDVTSVKFYYSDNINMTDKILHTDCNALTEAPDNTYTMTCNNINFVQYPIYFSILATFDGEDISSPPYILESQIGIVQDFQVLTQSAEPTIETFSLAVNFQVDENAPPTGFLNDWGKFFDDQATPGYGWIGSSPTDKRDRDNPLSPDQSYDTLIFSFPNYLWEAEVPNGTYKITVCVGDVSYSGDTANSLQVEGLNLINQEHTTPESRWIERDITVPVTEGRVSITFQNAAPRTTFCWIKIESI